MLFKPLREDRNRAWMGDVLRNELNTQLNQLSKVKVYSKEFIDFLITRENLTEYEAATRLGIKKMLSGSFVVMGDMLHIETHIVDVPTGVQEASYPTVGREEEFPALQHKMTMDVIAHLNVSVTDEERRTLAAQTATDIDRRRLLLEAEGGAPPKEPPSP